MADPSEMTPRQMRDELASLGFGTEGCYERADIEERLLAARRQGPRPAEPAPTPPPAAAPSSSSSSASSSAPRSAAGGGNTPIAKEIARILRTKNHYEILSVSPSATEEEIAKAYKKMAIKLHPDKCREPKAEDAFKLVSRAYDTLKNNRDRYDRMGDDTDLSAGRGTHVSPEDLFAEMFGPGFHFSPGGGGAFHMSFGPGGFNATRGGQRRARRGGGGGGEPRAAHAAGDGGGISTVGFLLIVFFLLLPVLLPLLTTLLPLLVMFSLANTLLRR